MIKHVPCFGTCSFLLFGAGMGERGIVKSYMNQRFERAGTSGCIGGLLTKNFLKRKISPLNMFV